jgi:hypothetical protein
MAYSMKIVGSLYVKATLAAPASRATSARVSGAARSARLWFSLDF